MLINHLSIAPRYESVYNEQDNRPRDKWNGPLLSNGADSLYKIDSQRGYAGDRVRLDFLGGCGHWEWMVEEVEAHLGIMGWILFYVK